VKMLRVAWMVAVTDTAFPNTDFFLQDKSILETIKDCDSN
jgi:hypothetical protein